jgi:hypothetical protein
VLGPVLGPVPISVSGLVLGLVLGSVSGFRGQLPRAQRRVQCADASRKVGSVWVRLWVCVPGAPRAVSGEGRRAAMRLLRLTCPCRGVRKQGAGAVGRPAVAGWRVRRVGRERLKAHS